MLKTRLGKSGLIVSRVGMGGIPLQRPPEAEAIRLVQSVLDLGVNWIDTSIGYGDSEIRIGKAIASRRDGVIIATKGGWRDKKTTENQINSSLRRLNVDYIDLWQLHGVNTLADFEEVIKPGASLEAAQEACASGKVRHVGISSHSLEVARRAVSSGLIECIQYPFNFVNSEAAEKLVPLCKQYDVGFIAMKPFNGGMMKDAGLSIKYLLQFDNVVPNPGIERPSEMEQIAAIVDGGDWQLTDRDRQRMEETRNTLGNRFCRMCGYCQPCPEGVELFWLTITQVNYNVWPQTQFFTQYPQHVESVKNCIQCGHCEEKCPYKLPVREIVAEGVELFQRVSGQRG